MPEIVQPALGARVMQWLAISPLGIIGLLGIFRDEPFREDWFAACLLFAVFLVLGLYLTQFALIADEESLTFKRLGYSVWQTKYTEATAKVVRASRMPFVEAVEFRTANGNKLIGVVSLGAFRKADVANILGRFL